MRIAFMHIPKTAGTSIRVALQEAFGPDNCYVLGLNEPWREFRKNAKSHADTPVLAGHFMINDIRSVPGPRKTFTVLRDPVDRVLSWYGYLRRREEIALHEWAALNDAAAFIEKCNEAVMSGDTSPQGMNAREAINGMCRRLDHAGTAEAALSMIKQRRILALDQSQLDSQTAQLEAFIETKLDLPRVNVTQKNDRTHVPESVRQRIAEVNREDSKLYEIVKARAIARQSS
ncbi:MAG: sulfotransferase family 2 domain-containing protein [Pseudomonadota bacterium]